MKTNDLNGAALDWAVAKCEGHDAYIYGGVVRTTMRSVFGPECHYSTNWAQGGPIIERERLNIVPTSIGWESYPDHGMSDELFETGPTPLIAAMRCYVASKLGDEVEIPKEITE
jgi:hypothetical protein